MSHLVRRRRDSLNTRTPGHQDTVGRFGAGRQQVRHLNVSTRLEDKESPSRGHDTAASRRACAASIREQVKHASLPPRICMLRFTSCSRARTHFGGPRCLEQKLVCIATQTVRGQAPGQPKVGADDATTLGNEQCAVGHLLPASR